MSYPKVKIDIFKISDEICTCIRKLGHDPEGLRFIYPSKDWLSDWGQQIDVWYKELPRWNPKSTRSHRISLDGFLVTRQRGVWVGAGEIIQLYRLPELRKVKEG